MRIYYKGNITQTDMKNIRVKEGRLQILGGLNVNDGYVEPVYFEPFSTKITGGSLMVVLAWGVPKVMFVFTYKPPFFMIFQPAGLTLEE